MDRIKKGLLIYLLLALPGFIAAAWRCGLRLMAESRDAYVETVIDFDEWRQLAREEGWRLHDMLNEASKNGASSVGISEDTVESLAAEERISVFTTSEIRKLPEGTEIASFMRSVDVPPGAIWIKSEDDALVDRIEQHLLWKLPNEKVRRLGRHLLLLRKSSLDFRQRVGLGFSRDLIDIIRSKQLGVILRIYNYPGLSDEAVRQIIADLPDPAVVSAVVFAEEEVLGNRGALPAVVRELKARSFRVGWIEFNDQAGMDTLIQGLRGSVPFARVHSIGRRELDENYTVGRAVARFHRAVRDRRLKMLYVRVFFQDKKKFIGDMVRFNLDYLQKIAGGLNDDGFRIPREDSQRRAEPRHLVGILSRGERLAIGLALTLGAVFLGGGISSRFPGSAWFFLVALLTGSGFILVSPESFTMVAGCLGVISYSAIGCLWAIDRYDNRCRIDQGLSISLLREVPLFFSRLVIPGIIGGILVAGLHSEPFYLLHYAQFRGIKLAFLLPLILVGTWSLRRFGGGLLSFFSRPLTARDLFIGAAVIIGTILYLMRSGNVTFLKPSAEEDLARTFLEDLLIARPRNKEFLVGYPAVLFFLFFRLRGAFGILPVLALFIEMGQVSMVNTFCHFHSPLALTFLRGFNGLWLGFLVGTAGMAFYLLCRLVAMAGNKQREGFLLGYFGFGNLGDELLWRTFVGETEKAGVGISWNLLVRGPGPGTLPAGVRPVFRQHLTMVLEAIARSRFLVIPGGGVLQSSTSSGSLLYYSLLLVFARLTGSRILMPSQGIGPWTRDPASEEVFPTIQRAFARINARMVFDGAVHLSARDRLSEEEILHLPGPPIQVHRATDLLFLPEWTTPPRTLSDRKKVGFILRGSNPESERLARLILDTFGNDGKMVAVPMSFQDREDSVSWKSAGYPGEIRKIDEIDPIGAFSDLDAVLSMRLHGCILASLAGVPWFGISHDPKIEGLAREMAWDFVAQPAWLNEETLPKTIQTLLSDPEGAETRLRRKTAELHGIARDDFRLVLDHLGRGERQ